MHYDVINFQKFILLNSSLKNRVQGATFEMSKSSDVQCHCVIKCSEYDSFLHRLWISHFPVFLWSDMPSRLAVSHWATTVNAFRCAEWNFASFTYFWKLLGCWIESGSLFFPLVESTVGEIDGRRDACTNCRTPKLKSWNIMKARSDIFCYWHRLRVFDLFVFGRCLIALAFFTSFFRRIQRE
jgi:hypothetical protein